MCLLVLREYKERCCNEPTIKTRVKRIITIYITLSAVYKNVRNMYVTVFSLVIRFYVFTKFINASIIYSVSRGSMPIVCTHKKLGIKLYLT